MRVLVTGAAGFIGSKLTALLDAKGYEVLATDRVAVDELARKVQVEGFVWDITHSEDIRKHVEGCKARRIEACIHLAAVASPRECDARPDWAYEANVRGTNNVLALCHAAGIRKVVFASSAHVYDISPRYLPTDEQHPLALLNTYTTSKVLGEELCDLYHKNHGLSTTVLRTFNAYGPGQSPDYFLGVKLQQARAREPITIMNAEVTKDWVHVQDVIEAFRRALHTEFVGPINIGTGVETSLGTIAGRIARATNLPLVPDASQDGSPTRMCCDWSRARNVLGWRPTVPIEAGLVQLIEELSPMAPASLMMGMQR